MAAAATSSSTFPMTLWLFATTPTRLPLRTRSTITRAPVYVLPEPGGPWIGRMPTPASATIRVAAVERRLSGSPQRRGRCLPGVGRPAQEQRADGGHARDTRVVRVDLAQPVLGDPVPRPQEALGQLLARHDPLRDDRSREGIAGSGQARGRS